MVLARLPAAAVPAGRLLLGQHAADLKGMAPLLRSTIANNLSLQSCSCKLLFHSPWHHKLLHDMVNYAYGLGEPGTCGRDRLQMIALCYPCECFHGP